MYMKTSIQLLTEIVHIKNFSVIPQEKTVKDKNGQKKTSGSVRDFVEANKTLYNDGNVSSVPANTAASRHLWLLSTWNVTRVTKLNFLSNSDKFK